MCCDGEREIHNGISSVDVLEYEDQIFLYFFWGGVGLVGFVVLWESGLTSRTKDKCTKKACKSATKRRDKYIRKELQNFKLNKLSFTKNNGARHGSYCWCLPCSKKYNPIHITVNCQKMSNVCFKLVLGEIIMCIEY